MMMIIEEAQLHFVSSIVILIAAAVPIYLTIKLSGELKRLTAILSIFIFIHAIYQIVSFYGFDLLADTVLEPLSAAILIYFGVVYYGLAKPKDIGSIKNMVVVLSPATILLLMNSITIVLLLAALGIFIWLAAAQSKNIKSFQFQFPIFIIIWLLGDLVNILHNNGIVVFSSFQNIVGEEIHVVSMFFFSVMLWLRYYYSQRSSKMMVEDLDATLR
jgi:hypothetical protein